MKSDVLNRHSWQITFNNVAIVKRHHAETRVIGRDRIVRRDASHQLIQPSVQFLKNIGAASIGSTSHGKFSRYRGLNSWMMISAACSGLLTTLSYVVAVRMVILFGAVSAER